MQAANLVRDMFASDAGTLALAAPMIGQQFDHQVSLTIK